MRTPPVRPADGVVGCVSVSYTHLDVYKRQAKGVAYIYSGGRSIRVSNDVFTGIGTGKLFGVLPLPVVYMICLLYTSRCV